MLANQLRLWLEGDLAGKVNRISGLDRGSDAISRDIDAGTEIGVWVAIEPEAVRTGSMYQPVGPMWVQ